MRILRVHGMNRLDLMGAKEALKVAHLVTFHAERFPYSAKKYTFGTLGEELE
jgi:hypothetical protein